MPSYNPDTFLTEWEAEFMNSIAAWEGELTDAQEAKLAEIEAAVEERRLKAETWGRHGV